MTVEEMLHRVSSHELSEWMAYEKHDGPLGRVYEKEMLAQILEAVMRNTYVEGMQYGEDNPAPKPTPALRPNEVLNRPEPQGAEALNAYEI